MKIINTIVLSAGLVLTAGLAEASNISSLTTFTANTTARASAVNGNFTAVQTAVNDNNSRISNLESNPGISGNLTLPESSDVNTGNIMKGAIPFLSNYGSYNTFLGEYAGNFTMTGTSGNTGIGYQALLSNATGNNNTATGYQVLYNNSGGYRNTAGGAGALYSNTSGYDNTASGFHALYTNTTGGTNVASGSNALMANIGGDGNTASGTSALGSNTYGSLNSALGDQALMNNTTGNRNIAVGYLAGSNLTTGDYNIDIESSGVPGEAYTIRIGDPYYASGTNVWGENRTFIAGISGTTVAGTTVVVDSNGQLGVASSSRRLKDHIRPMGDASDVLNKLHPVTFYYKTDHDPSGRHLQYGLVAEDVAKVAPQLVAYNKDGSVETVYYRFLAPMLLNEYQKQQKVILRQGAALKAQATLLHNQARQIVALRAQTREIAELKAQAVLFKRQSARLAVLEKEMTRINTILAMHKQPQRLADSGNP